MIPVAEGSISLNNHQHLEHRLGEIAEKIRNQGEKRKLLAKVLKRAKNDFQIPLKDENHGAIEPNLVYPVKEKNLKNLNIAGVDGGVLSKPLHGLDLILVRSIAAIFQYNGGGLKKTDYHPNEMPIPQLINIHEPLDSRELDVLVAMKRQLSELDRAREALSGCELDALIMDGSIVPQYTYHASRPRTRELYRDLIQSFTELYQTCFEKDVLLFGAIKDSRSTRLVNIFQKTIFPRLMENANLDEDELKSFNKNKDVLMNSRDTAFLDYLLEPRERSFTFSYAEAPANLLTDLGDWRNKVYAFYTKPVPYDRPVRVEFVSPPEESQEKTEKVASLINALSASHEACALPSVLIEADARAALAQEEISIIRDSIADRLEPSTMLDLRRERRPF